MARFSSVIFVASMLAGTMNFCGVEGGRKGRWGEGRVGEGGCGVWGGWEKREVECGVWGGWEKGEVGCGRGGGWEKGEVGCGERDMRYERDGGRIIMRGQRGEEDYLSGYQSGYYSVYYSG